MDKVLKDLLNDAFLCDECHIIFDNAQKILVRFNTEQQMFYKKPKELCYKCAVTKQEAI